MDEAVGALSSSAADACGAGVEADAGADEVDRYVAVVVGENRIGLALDLDGMAALTETPVVEFMEERQQPRLARETAGGIARSQVLALLIECAPCAGEPGPGSGDRFGEAFAREQVVVGRC